MIRILDFGSLDGGGQWRVLGWVLLVGRAHLTLRLVALRTWGFLDHRGNKFQNTDGCQHMIAKNKTQETGENPP